MKKILTIRFVLAALMFAVFVAVVLFGGEVGGRLIYYVGCWAIGGYIAQASDWLSEKYK